MVFIIITNAIKSIFAKLRAKIILITIWSLILKKEEITFTSQQEPTLSFFGDNLSLKRSISDIPIISDDNDHSNRKLLFNDNAYPITLTISPSELTTPNFGFETIQISWNSSNTSIQTWQDWIGIYSPPNASDIDYLDFFDVPFPYMNGMIEKRIFNLRDNYQCRYFIKDYNTDTFILSGISNIATVIPNQPLQGHLSLTKNSPNEMQIRWVSCLILNPMVKIGTISKNYTNTFVATYYTYDTTKMCCCAASIISAKQFRHPGYIYTAIINNLSTDTEYFYIFGNNEYWSAEESFITQSKDNTKTFGFIMYGDQGTGDEAYKLLDLINTEIYNDRNIKLLLHIGDLSYAWGNGYNWDKWCNMISKVAMKIPYMISIGNHEYDHLSSPNDGGNDVSGVFGIGYHPLWGNFHNDSNGECGVPSYYRFDADINENGNSIFWYSFNYQSVHFIILSSEHNYSIGTNGYKFLLNDLRYKV